MPTLKETQKKELQPGSSATSGRHTQARPEETSQTKQTTEADAAR